MRLNYGRKVLNYVKIIDTMSDNQKLIDDSFVINYVDSIDPWIDKGSAMELIKSMAKSEHDFEITMNRLDRMIYIWYKTKLTKPVKESNNPTNKVEVKAETDGGISHSYVQLVGGKGNASGETKPEPTWEIPNEAPKYEKPELNINDIPLMPPPPVVEIPELPLGDIPLLPPAPILDKPELPLEDIPLMPPPPVLDKPYLPIEDIPVLPPAPIVEIPELNIPSVPSEPNKPSKPSEPNKPQEPKPQPKEEVEVKNTDSEESPKPYNAPAVLPATGTDLSLSLVALSMSGFALSFVLVRNKKD